MFKFVINIWQQQSQKMLSFPLKIRFQTLNTKQSEGYETTTMMREGKRRRKRAYTEQSKPSPFFVSAPRVLKRNLRSSWDCESTNEHSVLRQEVRWKWFWQMCTLKHPLTEISISTNVDCAQWEWTLPVNGMKVLCTLPIEWSYHYEMHCHTTFIEQNHA